jgi:hypothetical protein
MNPRIESLEKMLGGPRDGALLRFSLGNEYLKAESPPKPPQPFRPPSTATRTIPPPGRPGQGTLASGDDSGALAAYEKGLRWPTPAATSRPQGDERLCQAPAQGAEA